MKISLLKNKGYHWTKKNGTYFKGYFQYSNSDWYVFRESDAVNELSNIKNYEDFETFLKRVDGVFAIIIDCGETAYIAVDRARSMPIYFCAEEGVISDNSDEVRRICGITKEDVDSDQFLAFFTADYLTGNSTIYTQIQQLDLGQMAKLESGGIQISQYYYHLNKVIDSDDNEIKGDLTKVSNDTFARIKAVIAGRPVVLSMSGGYDSRYVGCMLKSLGVEDVSCYTYGKPDSFEVIQSKKNADALGYRWKCVEYTDEEILKILDSTGQEYLDMCNEHDYRVYIQNLAAVRKLHEEGWFKARSVFITGLCGDMPTGKYLVPYDESAIYNVESATEHLYKLIFTRFNLDEEFHKQWINNVQKVIEDYPIKVNDYQTWTSAVDCFYTGSSHARLYLNMNRVHEFFGYEWLLPYWDKELLSQWYSIPVKKKLGQAFYEDWLLTTIAEKFGIGTKKKTVSYPSNPMKNKIYYLGGSCLAFCMLNLGIPFRRSYDFNNFAPLELKLYQKLKDKKLVSYRKAGIEHLLSLCLLQTRYGVKIVREAHKRIKE